jgi:hypothetical protein
MPDPRSFQLRVGGPSYPTRWLDLDIRPTLSAKARANDTEAAASRPDMATQLPPPEQRKHGDAS